jgi:hypothetical protein
MKTPGRERGQVLILLGTWWLLFGGGAASALVVYDQSASDMKKAVKRVIKDTDRRDVLLADIDHWEYVQQNYDKKVSDAREELLKKLRRKDAQRSDAEPVMAQLDDTFLIMDRDFLNLRFRVKQQVTSAEWAEILARAKH